MIPFSDFLRRFLKEYAVAAGDYGASQLFILVIPATAKQTEQLTLLFFLAGAVLTVAAVVLAPAVACRPPARAYSCPPRRLPIDPE